MKCKEDVPSKALVLGICSPEGKEKRLREVAGDMHKPPIHVFLSVKEFSKLPGLRRKLMGAKALFFHAKVRSSLRATMMASEKWKWHAWAQKEDAKISVRRQERGMHVDRN